MAGNEQQNWVRFTHNLLHTKAKGFQKLFKQIAVFLSFQQSVAVADHTIAAGIFHDEFSVLFAVVQFIEFSVVEGDKLFVHKPIIYELCN